MIVPLRVIEPSRLGETSLGSLPPSKKRDPNEVPPSLAPTLS